MVKKVVVLLWAATVLAVLIPCACSKKGGGEKAVRLKVSVPAVTPELIAKDVMDQEHFWDGNENWKKYDSTVVRWSGAVVEPDSLEKAEAARNFAYDGRTLVVVEVKGLRVQVPSDKPFDAGTAVAFTAMLNGYSAIGDYRKVYVARYGLSIKTAKTH